MAAQLIVEKLWVRYPTPARVIEAVRGVSFGLGREKLGIVGESGSGKFTVGRAILRLVPPPGRGSRPLATMLSMTAALALTACTQLGTCATEATIADYRLRSGDQVHVTVHGHEELRGEFEVDREGNLAAPLPISARPRGLTGPQLESEIEARLEWRLYE